jgi:glycosyltransferase involved in cell wall biosynthesis
MNILGSTPLLSVIITTYQNGRYLYETIDSVLHQDYPNMELLVAEDGSLDFSVAEVEKYIFERKCENISRCSVYCNSHNLGTVNNIRGALQQAKGDYIKIIAGDDLLGNNSICSSQIEWLQEHPQQELVVSDCVECTVSMEPRFTVGFAPNGKEYLLLSGQEKKLLRYLCRDHFGCMATQSCCFRKSFFLHYDLPDARFRLIEDLPMAVYVVTKKIPFGYLSCDSVLHRGFSGVSTASVAFDTGRMTYFRDLLTYYEQVLTPLQDIVGKRFVCRRKQLCDFRLNMCEATLCCQKLRLILQYMPAILYFSLTRLNRVAFYLTGRK